MNHYKLCLTADQWHKVLCGKLCLAELLKDQQPKLMEELQDRHNCPGDPLDPLDPPNTPDPV